LISREASVPELSKFIQSYKTIHDQRLRRAENAEERAEKFRARLPIEAEDAKEPLSRHEMINGHSEPQTPNGVNPQAQSSVPIPEKPWRAKVALIDSGVVVVGNRVGADGKDSSNIGEQIVEAASFVLQGGEEQPWWHASTPHGTQMAALICAIDLCCDLNVTKVGDNTTSGVTPERVADVSNASHIFAQLS
jgi:hypothetical protein